MTIQLRHAMIDLETLDTIPSSKIVAIGAVIFDPRYGKISDDKFYVLVDHKLQTGDRTSSPDTVKWWKSQSPEVRKQLKGTTSLADALEDLSFWLPNDCKVWGNGATFDISILEDAYRQLNIDIPWKFWNVRDCRTVLDMYESARGGFNKKSGGTLHNALDDAYYQAQYITMMWKKLLKQ